jgi:hypothetical protein
LCGYGEPSAAAMARISIKTDRDFIQSRIGISFKFESNAIHRKPAMPQQEKAPKYREIKHGEPSRGYLSRSASSRSMRAGLII